MGRLQYWDVAKGITILLVIMGHLPETPEQVKQAIYTFHMPFFFIANAFFIKHYDVKVHMRKNAKSLLVPYMVVCILEAFCYSLRGNTDVYRAYDIRQLSGNVISGSDMTFMGIFLDKLADMFVGISFTSTRFKEFESIWIVWFLAVLFVAKVMYVGIRKLTSMCCEKLHVEMNTDSRDGDKSNWIVLGVILCISVVGMLIGQKYAFLPWSVDVAMACLPFMWVGEYLHNSNVMEQKNSRIYFVLCLITWIILTSMGFRGELALRIYPAYLIWMINAIAGSIVVIGIARWLSANSNKVVDILTWCGRNSIIILGIHCIEHRFFDWNIYVYDRIPMDLHWIVLFFIHAIAIVCSAWVIVKCKRKLGVYLKKCVPSTT